MKIIGIAGTDGSGKDSIGEMLAKQGWLFVSVTDLLRDEAKKRGVSLERKNLRQISAEWRRKQGLGVLVDRAVELFKPQKSQYKGLVMASLRNPGEVDRVHELGGLVAWVDADPHTRYERVSSRNRGTEDHISFNEFMAEEQAQMHHSGDGSTLSLSGVKTKADIFLQNNGSLEEFQTAAKRALGL